MYQWHFSLTRFQMGFRFGSNKRQLISTISSFHFVEWERFSIKHTCQTPIKRIFDQKNASNKNKVNENCVEPTEIFPSILITSEMALVFILLLLLVQTQCMHVIFFTPFAVACKNLLTRYFIRYNIHCVTLWWAYVLVRNAMRVLMLWCYNRVATTSSSCCVCVFFVTCPM